MKTDYSDPNDQEALKIIFSLAAIQIDKTIDNASEIDYKQFLIKLADVREFICDALGEETQAKKALRLLFNNLEI